MFTRLDTLADILKNRSPPNDRSMVSTSCACSFALAEQTTRPENMSRSPPPKSLTWHRMVPTVCYDTLFYNMLSHKKSVVC